ncbi:unnamed protein product [Phyllotreta striolata]|uniref:Box C/D snoRNA protein 1 n=1 Tax=Phyllotreta striolata TaxID=444603 RepID=A0A9N9XLP3_PHYSR|nr:unnamed protein product [Phyllotreta striolata]
MDNESLTTKITPESTTTTNKSRLGFCEVCAFYNAKYTCPRCELKTCSLKCIKIHKLELDCSGDRDRTKYIPLNKFTNLDLTSDYRLLEEVSRSLENSRKHFRGIRWNNIPHRLIRLRNVAKSQKIELKFLPPKFARHKNNATYLKLNRIFWHIEWVFVNSDNTILHDSNVPDTQKLCSTLERHLDANNEALAEKLQYYRAVGLSGIKLLLKAEQKGGKKFYEIDGNVQLKESLQKKIIIEYPTIHVVLKDHSCGYNIIDSDDDEEIEESNKHVKSGHQIVNRIINKAEEDDANKSSKNFLFVNEYSDAEVSDDD